MATPAPTLQPQNVLPSVKAMVLNLERRAERYEYEVNLAGATVLDMWLEGEDRSDTATWLIDRANTARELLIAAVNTLSPAVVWASLHGRFPAALAAIQQADERQRGVK